MHNMSNQFYNYLAKQLIRYWKNNNIQVGNRFFLQFDDKQEVENIVNALQTADATIVEPFSYEHELGELYETFSLRFNNIRLVVAATTNGVLTDYLATVRNLVSNQEAGWENTALISIVSEQLDTIPGGSLDMQSEGMPLHPFSLFANIKNEIQQSNLTKAERLILEDNLDKLLEDHKLMRLSTFDFEEILATLHKEKIEVEDYKNLGMFQDPDLDSFSGKSLKQRINDNRELYEYVRQANEYNDTEEALQKKFTNEGIKDLMTENWQEIAFTSVLKDRQKFDEINRKQKVSLESLISQTNELIWNRENGKSTAAKRKRNIIVFNPDKKDELTLIAKFDLQGAVRSLNTKDLEVKDAIGVNVDVKTTNIHIHIKTNEQKPTFARVIYKHNNTASLGAELAICVLPTDPYLFEHISSSFIVDTRKKGVKVKLNGSILSFGNDYPINNFKVKEVEEVVELNQYERNNIEFSPEIFEEESDIVFTVKIGDLYLPIIVDSELTDSTPIKGNRIWKLVRESMTDMIWIKELKRLTHNLHEYYIESKYAHYYEWEYKWIDKGLRHGKIESGILIPQDVELSETLREAYSRFLAYFKLPMIPSLCHVSVEYEKRARDYLKEFISEIECFKTGIPVGKKGVNLYKLGIIEAEETLYLTPFHPLMVAYKLKVYELLGSEEVDNVILNRLTPEALLPFIEKHELYRPQHQDDAPEWLAFKSVNKVTVADSVQYLSNVITDKMKQFKEHFGYLFTDSSKAPILINIMNLPDDLQVLKGILSFMNKEISKHGIQAIKPIEITLYTNTHVKSAFEYFSEFKTNEQIIEFTGLKFGSREIDTDTVIRIIRENLYFYRRFSKDHKWDLRYAHITFYKMHSQESSAVQSMADMKSDLALEGVYASVPAMRDAETYKSGFGIKDYKIEENDYLVKTAYYVNELAANVRNEGNNSYVKGNTILSRVNSTDEATLLEIFDHSHWVTFVDPTVDLEFFNEFNNDLIVIHYSDQYTSSNKFDAITVTNKSNQYYKVIKEFLQDKEIEGTDENIKNTIKAFNTFNGEWLLRIIGTKGYTDREKLSIISAIKYTLAYIDQNNIKWIPISLEEILRVAGVFNLSKGDGIFTAKNLGVKGPTSDDLLLIGLEEQEDQLYMHFYPVEVKFGLNGSDTISKAKAQVSHTKTILLDALLDKDKETFKQKFYKNFFVQLLISNANKMVQGGIWDQKGYNLHEAVIEKLVKLDFEISDHLTPYIGKGAVVSFKEGLSSRTAYLDEEINIINFSKEDGFNGIVKDMEQIRNWLHFEETDFIKERLLIHQYLNQANTESGEIKNIEVGTEDNVIVIKQEEPIQNSSIGHFSEPVNKEEVKEPVPKLPTEKVADNELKQYNFYPELKDIRIKIGKIENSNKEIYWEYGNKGLANRHLLISGKSGQGKTYFMQCLLLEKAKQGISSIVIDYTEGFLPNQLETEFTEYLGNKLTQQIVYNDKLPINPFTRNTRDIGGIQLPETNTDIAERVKSVFAAVYNTLGIQQLNTIYDRILVGLERYDSKMNLTYLKELLEEDGSNTALKTLSQLRPLIDRNPFKEGETINWKEIMDRKGDVFVIQLTGFPRDVQLIITEFLLWDLWNFSVREGNKDNPLPVIMDEAQNLDHTEESPSARVLTEGRKFGWSAWYATQFLKSQLDSSEISRLQMASQKIYFAPPEQEVGYIAGSLANEYQDRRYWENVLNNLKKGQCIVQGPNLEANGTLSSPAAVVVNISPLEERI